jgi:hypothetical protein
MGLQSCKSPNFGNPRTKWHLGASHMAKHRIYYKGEGDGFLWVQAMVSLMSLCLLVVCLCTKGVLVTH